MIPTVYEYTGINPAFEMEFGDEKTIEVHNYHQVIYIVATNGERVQVEMTPETFRIFIAQCQRIMEEA